MTGKNWCPRHGMIDWDGTWGCAKCRAAQRIAEDRHQMFEQRRRRSIWSRIGALFASLNPWKRK